MPDRPPIRLEVSNLSRSFGGRRVVDQVSLSVAAGQVTCLLGPSGCGKSTTLRMIAGVERADAGEVRLDGQLVAGPGVHVPPEVRSVGLMFQDFALFPHLTVAENVGFGLRIDRAEKVRAQTQTTSRNEWMDGWMDGSFIPIRVHTPLEHIWLVAHVSLSLLLSQVFVCYNVQDSTETFAYGAQKFVDRVQMPIEHDDLFRHVWSRTWEERPCS